MISSIKKCAIWRKRAKAVTNNHNTAHSNTGTPHAESDAITDSVNNNTTHNVNFAQNVSIFKFRDVFDRFVEIQQHEVRSLSNKKFCHFTLKRKNNKPRSVLGNESISIAPNFVRLRQCCDVYGSSACLLGSSGQSLVLRTVATKFMRILLSERTFPRMQRTSPSITLSHYLLLGQESCLNLNRQFTAFSFLALGPLPDGDHRLYSTERLNLVEMWWVDAT